MAGMYPGDHVLKVNDTDVSEMHAAEVVKEIVRGTNSNRLVHDSGQHLGTFYFSCS